MRRLGFEAIPPGVPELERMESASRQAARLPLRSAMQTRDSKSKVACGAFAPAQMKNTDCIKDTLILNIA